MFSMIYIEKKVFYICHPGSNCKVDLKLERLVLVLFG